MKDLILGEFVDYSWDQLKFWVNSIKQSGFEGDVVVIAARASFDTVQKLSDAGVKVAVYNRDDAHQMYWYQPEGNYPIHDERFLHFYQFLTEAWINYRYIILSDMKDVIFQSNPSKWLEDYLTAELVIGSECILYKDEPWGNQNLKDVWGESIYNAFKNQISYCVGLMAGKSEWVKDLCLNSYRRTRLVEQANINVMLHTMPWNKHTQFAMMYQGLVAHLGTVMDPNKIEQFGPLLIEPEPIIDGDAVKTSDGNPFVAVHQYDRVPELKELIERKYG